MHFSENLILITTPAYPYTFLNYYNDIEGAMAATFNDQEANSDVLAIINDASNNYIQNEGQLKEALAADKSSENHRLIYYLCEFPEELKFSSSLPNNPNYKEEDLKL